MSRARAWGALTILAAALHASGALAADWKSSLSLGLSATATDNVNLAPADQKDADLYFTLTPGIRTARDAARLKTSFSYTPSLTAHVNRSASDRWYNNLAAHANLEAVPEFYFVDATATISQTFLSPFAALPSDLGTFTENRVETYGLRVSPYIKGTFGKGGTYELRNSSSVTASDSSLTNASSQVSWLARASTPLWQRLSLTLEGSRSVAYYRDQSGLRTSVARALLTYRLNPDVSFTLRGGYESNNYATIGDTSRSFYGLGATWTPTPRTNITAFFEDRFFGTGYNVSATHRRRLSSISLHGSRDVSSYPQLLFTLPPGDARSLLDAALTARIPDPVQRQAAVEQLMLLTGTPSTLIAPLSFYTERINLVQSVGGSVALLGVRNTVVLSLSWLESDPVSTISGQPLPPQLAGLDRYMTYGAGLNWSHRLTGRTRASVLLSRYYSEKLDVPDDHSTNLQARLQLHSQFGPSTTGSVGYRWSRFDSSLAQDYTENAVFLTGYHSF